MRLLSRTLADPCVARLTLIQSHRQPLPWLEQNLKIETGPQTGLMLVSFREGTPREQAVVINALVDALGQLVKELGPVNDAKVWVTAIVAHLEMLDSSLDRERKMLSGLKEPRADAARNKR